MTRDQMLAELRVLIDDTVPDYGWSDPLLLDYLAEGQDVLCEDTGLFRDGFTYTIDTVVDQADYPIDDRIIEVLDIWYGTQRLGKFQEQDKDYGTLSSTAITIDPGQSPPAAWQADNSTGYITLRPVPNDIRTLTLRVHRYSLDYLADDNVLTGLPATPEVPRRIQRGCIEWAAYKAFMHHDRELQDPVKAGDHLSAYKMYVTAGKKVARRLASVEFRIEGNPLYVVNP